MPVYCVFENHGRLVDFFTEQGRRKLWLKANTPVVGYMFFHTGVSFPFRCFQVWPCYLASPKFARAGQADGQWWMPRFPCELALMLEYLHSVHMPYNARPSQLPWCGLCCVPRHISHQSAACALGRRRRSTIFLDPEIQVGWAVCEGTQIQDSFPLLSLLIIVRCSCRHAVIFHWPHGSVLILQQRANIAQTIYALLDFRAKVREGWRRYISSTYGTGKSVEDSSAVQGTETCFNYKHNRNNWE